MLKLFAVIGTVAYIVYAAAPAGAVADLWAVDTKGEPAKLRGFTHRERVYSIEEHTALNSAMQKKFAHKVVFCNQDYYVSTATKRWISVHTKAKSRIVLRSRLPKGKFRDVC